MPLANFSKYSIDFDIMNISPVSTPPEQVTGHPVDMVALEGLHSERDTPRAGEQDQCVDPTQVHVEGLPGGLERGRLLVVVRNVGAGKSPSAEPASVDESPAV